MFAPLKDNPALSKNVTVDCGGCGISWNGDIDISECELWENGAPIETANFFFKPVDFHAGLSIIQITEPATPLIAHRGF